MKNFCNKSLFSIFLLVGAMPSMWASAVPEITKIDGVLVAGKAFNDDDCLKYLDRPIREYGYQPVQIIIKNDSDKNLIFSPDQVGLPCARVEYIMHRAHTFTAGRSVGYSVAAVFISVLFVIPAIVDGVKSYNANKALDVDYFSKAAKKTLITPNTTMNAVIFVPLGSYTDSFRITLLEEGTNRKYQMLVTMC